jgi:peptidoglycan/xylan/chitin deacetylase (PgdA/CDA1 family)
MPVTLFVPTAYPGDPARRFWWDRLSHALRTSGQRVLMVEGVRHDLGDESSRLATFRRLRALVKATAHDRAMAMVDDWCAMLGLPDAPSSVLDWTALRALAAEGVTIAAHSRTHPLLTRLDTDALPDEIGGSRDDLERELGSVPTAFAYPSGDHDEAVVSATGRLGFEMAFTTERGLVDLRHVEPLRLRRINVGGATSIAALRLQLIRGIGAPLAAIERD